MLRDLADLLLRNRADLDLVGLLGARARLLLGLEAGRLLGADFRSRTDPRLAFEKSGNNWFANNKLWHRAAGKAFAINFWYGTLMCVNETTLDFINDKMPDVYAAMSPAEYFAELYALHFDIDDKQRKHIPADVKQWLDGQLGKAERTQPSRPVAAGSRARGRPARGAQGKGSPT